MRQFLKYELKNNWKTFIINYSLVLFSFISLAIFILVNKLDIDYSTFTFILYANILLFVGGSMILGAILFSINLVKSFYNSIYSDEGYLTLSFPKSCHVLFIAKIVSNLIWVFGFIVSIVIGVTIVTLSGDGSVSTLFESLFEIINFDYNNIIMTPYALISLLSSILLSYVLLLLSFTLVNLGGTRKGKMILGLVIFMGLSYAMTVLKMFTRYLSCGLAINYDGKLVFAFGAVGSDLFNQFNCLTYTFNITKFILNISLTIGFYILNTFLFNKKLEME